MDADPLCHPGRHQNCACVDIGAIVHAGNPHCGIANGVSASQYKIRAAGGVPGFIELPRQNYRKSVGR